MRKLGTTIIAAIAFTSTVFAATPAETAAKASAESILANLNGGNLVGLFEMIPTPHQKDLNALAKAFGEKMDPEIYGAASDLIKNLADVGIAQSELLAKSVDDDDLNAAKLKQISTAVKSLTEVMTLDTLKQGNVKSIVSNPKVADLGKLMAVIMKDEAPAKVVKAKEKSATVVEITTKDSDGDEDTEDFMLVEGVWLPEDIFEDWEEDIKEMKESIAKLTFTSEEKTQILSTLKNPMIKMALNQMKQAKSEDELMMPVMMLMGLFGGGMGMGM